MKRFLSVVMAFTVPLALLFSLFYAAVLRSGEALSVYDAADQMAQGQPMLYGTAYRYNARDLKQAMAAQKGADLLVLGSSRCMQLRSEFFLSDSFFNAGGGAGYSNEYLFFLQALPADKLPQTLILQFDQFNYQEQWGVWRPEPSQFAYAENPFKPLYSIRKAMTDWAAGKYRLREALFPVEGRKGLAAVGQHSGFRPDGSYDYGRLNQQPETGDDPGFSATMRKIDFGTSRFEWDSDVYPLAMQDTEALLAFCQQNNIHVVALLPPYAPSVIAKMQASGHYGYLDKLPAELAALCARYQYEFYDFTSMDNTTDEEFIDGYHGSDRVYCKIALQLAEQSTTLAPYLQAEPLNQMLENQPGIRGFVF